MNFHRYITDHCKGTTLAYFTEDDGDFLKSIKIKFPQGWLARYIEKIGYYGFGLFKTIYIFDQAFSEIYQKERPNLSIQALIFHEYTHLWQQRCYGWKWYFSYVLAWLWNMIKYRNSQKAYENISYEISAVSNARSLIHYYEFQQGHEIYEV